ncbi:MAG: hypothetical protein JWO58_2018 [Chitinophagaceae bacterium]|nr:hypothetical protein [Chitinophagaceae bacterium]
MKNKIVFIRQISLLILIIFLFSAGAFVKNSYSLSKDYIITIHGDSNLHDWVEKVEQVSGNATVEKNSDESFDLTDINIKLVVHSIKSDMGSVMNNNTYEALKADANPTIVFTLLTPVKAIVNSTAKKIIAVKGNLTIAGVTNTVILPVNVNMPNDQTLHFEGAQLIKMSDYNIKPPTALFGTLKTGNQITLHFKTNFIVNTP